MNVVLCIGVISLCGYIGFSVSKSYTTRKKFFFNFASFLNQLKNEINFNVKKIDDLLPSINCNSKELSVLISNYITALKSCDNLSKNHLFKNINILSTQEQESIFNFFKSLGKLDIFNQISTIENFAVAINEYYKTATEENKKYSSLYVKLGIIIGAFIALIIV